MNHIINLKEKDIDIYIWRRLETLENGLEILVPLFVNIGDKVRIDTRTGEYMERV